MDLEALEERALALLQDPLLAAAVAGVTTLACLLAIYHAMRQRAAANAARGDLGRSTMERGELVKTLGLRDQQLNEARKALRAAEEKLAHASWVVEGSKDQWRSMAEAAPGLILTVDRRGVILFTNRRPPGEGQTVGASVFRIAPSSQEPLLRELLERTIAKGEAASRELRLDTPAGPVWWLVRMGPVRQDGLVVAAVVMATDVTEMRRALDARREADEQRLAADEQRREVVRLEELSLSKSQLLDTAAHELANPLQAIRLQFAVLDRAGDAGLAPAQKKALDVLRRNFRRLGLLVQDMRDLTRIQSGKLHLAPAPHDIGRIAAEVVEALQEVAQNGGVSLQAKVASRLTAQADADRIAQVLFNLVGNAIKFTPAGGSVVVEAAAEGDAVLLRVRDTGRGLPPEAIAKLFQPFQQVHDPTTVKEKGTGLGLFISKGIVEAHGGQLTVTSAGPGEGCTFTVALPAAAEPPEILFPSMVEA